MSSKIIEKNQHHPLTFIAITFIISSLFYFLIISSGHIDAANYRYNFGLMWSPGMAALICCWLYKRDYAVLGFTWGSTNIQIWSYLTPLIYTVLAYGLLWTFGFAGFPEEHFVKITADSFGWKHYSAWAVIAWQFLLIATFGVVKGCANTLGEELGWRGYLTPILLKRTSYTGASLVIGIIWAIWHFPILLFADYHSDNGMVWSLTCFTVMTIALNFMYTWFRIRSQSVWTGVIIHSSHNMFIQSFFTPVSSYNKYTPFWIDEFGAMLMIISLLVGGYFWSRRKELDH